MDSTLGFQLISESFYPLYTHTPTDTRKHTHTHTHTHMKNTHPFTVYKLKSILLIYYLPAYKEIHPSKMLRHFAEKNDKTVRHFALRHFGRDHTTYCVNCDISGEQLRHIALGATFCVDATFCGCTPPTPHQ